MLSHLEAISGSGGSLGGVGGVDGVVAVALANADLLVEDDLVDGEDLGLSRLLEGDVGEDTGEDAEGSVEGAGGEGTVDGCKMPQGYRQSQTCCCRREPKRERGGAEMASRSEDSEEIK